MLLVPPVTPVTTPVPAPIVATAALELDHAPPPLVSVKVVVLPWQTDFVPLIISSTKIVTVVVVTHPAGVTYVMIVDPGPTPVTTPLFSPIVATPGLLLVHVPPVTASASVDVPPAHILVTPVIAGAVFTVTISVELHAPNV